MEYYFTPKQYISTATLAIVDEEAKHVAKVLRKKSGEEIFVTDGEGTVYRARITNLAKELVDCIIIEKFQNLNEPKTKITLFQSLIKNPDRFEFAIEKSVELGVHCIQPVVADNVINKTTNKSERWQSIALAAMKQSQRCYLPKINEPVSFNIAIESVKEGLKLIAHEKTVDNILTPFSLKTSGLMSAVNLFIGPEGGFTDAEITFAQAYGFEVLNLGERKYRSETAAILAIGLLLAS